MAEEEGSAQQKEVVHVWDMHSLGDCPVTKKQNCIEGRLWGERVYWKSIQDSIKSSLCD